MKEKLKTILGLIKETEEIYARYPNKPGIFEALNRRDTAIFNLLLPDIDPVIQTILEGQAIYINQYNPNEEVIDEVLDSIIEKWGLDEEGKTENDLEKEPEES